MLDLQDCTCSNRERGNTGNNARWCGDDKSLFEVLLCLLFCTPKSREIPCFLAENGRSLIFFKRGVTLQSLGTSWEREWQAGRKDSSLRSNGLLVLWGKGQNRSKKQDQKKLGEWERLLFFFHPPTDPPTPLFFCSRPVPFRALCAVVRKQLFCRLRIRVLPVSNASLVYS